MKTRSRFILFGMIITALATTCFGQSSGIADIALRRAEGGEMKTKDINPNDPCSPFFNGTVYRPCDFKPFGDVTFNSSSQRFEVTLVRQAISELYKQYVEAERKSGKRNPVSYDTFASDLWRRALARLNGDSGLKALAMTAPKDSTKKTEVNVYWNYKKQEVGVRIFF